MSRFERQLILKGFGPEGQQKLQQSSVLVVGAGGLGCPALLYLAAAGVGTIGIVDGDHINPSNLNRQILFGVEDIGKSKATTAAHLLKQKYPDIQINVHQEYLQLHNMISILEDYDLVVDGSDNFPTRYMLNDACNLLKKPYVMAAIYQYEGQLAVLNLPNDKSRPINYRDIFPATPKAFEVPNCNDIGVLGVLPGIMGILQAAEALKILSGFGNPLKNKMIHYNFLNNTFYEIELSPNPLADLNTPKNMEEFYNMDYVMSCGGVETKSWKDAMDAFRSEKHTILVDVREKCELPSSAQFSCLRIPIGQLERESLQLQDAEAIFFFCQTGKRSAHAAVLMKSRFPNKHIYSIEEGVLDPNAPF